MSVSKIKKTRKQNPRDITLPSCAALIITYNNYVQFIVSLFVFVCCLAVDQGRPSSSDLMTVVFPPLTVIQVRSLMVAYSTLNSSQTTTVIDNKSVRWLLVTVIGCNRRTDWSCIVVMVIIITMMSIMVMIYLCYACLHPSLSWCSSLRPSTALKVINVIIIILYIGRRGWGGRGGVEYFLFSVQNPSAWFFLFSVHQFSVLIFLSVFSTEFQCWLLSVFSPPINVKYVMSVFSSSVSSVHFSPCSKCYKTPVLIYLCFEVPASPNFICHLLREQYRRG